MVVAGSSFTTVESWDTKTGVRGRTFAGHTGLVRSCTFSHNGLLLATASDDHTAKIWNPFTGTCLFTLRGHTSYTDRRTNRVFKPRVFCCTFSPDDLYMATGSTDTTVIIWTVQTGKPIRTLIGHSSTICSCAYSLDGSLLASACYDATARIWNPRNGACLSTLVGHMYSVLDCVFSPRNVALVATTGHMDVKLWDASTGICTRTLIGHTSSVVDCAYSPDGLFLVTTSADTTTRIWAVSTGTCAYILQAWTRWVVECKFSSDKLVMGCADGSIRTWQMPDHQHVNVLLVILYMNRIHRIHQIYRIDCRPYVPPELWEWMIMT